MAVFVRRSAPKSAALSSKAVRQMAECMLEVLGLSGLELSILLTNDKQIQQINRAHRDKDKPTDVLSFPQNEFVRPEVPKRNSAFHVLGDVVISIDTAAHQAQGRHRPLVEEVRFLLAHGLLHLLGHDHLTPAEKKVMTARTRYLVRNTPLPASVSAR